MTRGNGLIKLLISVRDFDAINFDVLRSFLKNFKEIH